MSATARRPWSTAKVLLSCLALTFAVMFLGNGIFNELLGLGVPTAVFGGVSGALMSFFVMRWRVLPWNRTGDPAA